MEVLLAYALFIIMLAIPFLVIGATAATFLGGRRNGRSGLSPLQIILVLLMVGSGAAAMIKHWATSPPIEASATNVHRVVYQTFQGTPARQQAMRWLRDGTFERLAKEGRGRDAERAAPSSAEGGK